MTVELHDTPFPGGVQEIQEVDRQILALLETRRTLTSGLHDQAGAPTPFYPESFDVDVVLNTYRGRLGGPGELVARAVLNLCRAAGAH